MCRSLTEEEVRGALNRIDSGTKKTPFCEKSFSLSPLKPFQSKSKLKGEEGLKR